MPKQRNPNRDRAYKIYEQYSGNIENRRIAEQLSEDERLIATWKFRDKWVERLKKNNDVHQSLNDVHQKTVHQTKDSEEKEQSYITAKKPRGEAPVQPPTPTDSKNNSKRRGGQPNNKNAVGNNGGAPLNNKNAVTTGEYETITYKGLSDEEKALLSSPIDKTEEQLDIISLSRILRHRMFKRLTAAEVAPGGMVIDSVIKTKGAMSGGGGKVNARRNAQDSTQTVADSSEKRFLQIAEALTRVMAGTQKGINQLHKMQMEDEKHNNPSDDLVDDWIAGILNE